VFESVATSFLRNWEVPPWKDYSGMAKIVRYQLWWLFEMSSTVYVSQDNKLVFTILNEDLGFDQKTINES
jgi:hypothetical protein